ALLYRDSSFGRLAQLARAPPLQGGGRGIETLNAHNAESSWCSHGRRARNAYPYTSNARAFSSPVASAKVSTGGPLATSTNPPSSSICCQPARGSPPAV